MKRLDRLVIGELVGPWVFGVAIFTVLIMAGSFLYEITRYLSEGASFLVTMQLLGLLLPGIISKTLSMATLLATLLSFGRLSGDSEVVALRAAGVSIARIMVPVAVFGASVALVTFVVGNYVVPPASLQALALKTEITRSLDGDQNQDTSQPIMKDGKLQAYLVAVDFNIARQRLTGAVITFFDREEKPAWFLSAKEMIYRGEDDWSITGGELVSAAGGSTIKVGSAWPEGIDKPKFSPSDLIARNLRDLDVLSMDQLADKIATQKAEPNPDLGNIANLEFGYWNKIALPLSALVFALVGAPLGIRNHRAGAATGFWLSVIIIFGYLLLANVMSIMSQGGAIPAWMASFTPIIVGLGASVFLIQQRNK